MTVKDLIEVLQQCPEPESEAKTRYVYRNTSGGLDWVDSAIVDVHEDRGLVIIETEVEVP